MVNPDEWRDLISEEADELEQSFGVAVYSVVGIAAAVVAACLTLFVWTVYR